MSNTGRAHVLKIKGSTRKSKAKMKIFGMNWGVFRLLGFWRRGVWFVEVVLERLVLECLFEVVMECLI